MVKAATQRGVCFEVTYSGIFADVQTRRQLISSAKLLMDWTRGQKIVFSSAAPTVNELRGPCDVANLLSLFGLSKERANAAISKNCRILLANSLRKKRFYKEAIRVEVLSSDAASHSMEDRYQELLQWDPISSGEGDILLNDIQKSSLGSCKASKTAKAIDFTSVVNSLPSNGFEIKNILPTNNTSDKIINFAPVAKSLNQSTPVPKTFTEQSNGLDNCRDQVENSRSDATTRSHILSHDNVFEKNITSGTTDAVNFKEIDIPIAIDSVFPEDKVNFLPVVKEINQWIPVPNDLAVQPDRLDVCPEQGERSQPLQQSDDYLEKLQSGTSKSFNSMEIDSSKNATKLKQRSFIDSDVDFIPIEAKAFDSQSNMDISSIKLDTVKPCENKKLCGSVQDVNDIFPAPGHAKHYNEKSSDVNLNEPVGKIDEALSNENSKIYISDTSMEDKQFNKLHDAVEHEKMQQLTSYDEMKMEDNSKAVNHLNPDVVMKDKTLGEVSTESDQFASLHSVSGRLKLKRRTLRGLPLFPFKRLLNPVTLKKKVKKSKSRTKLK